MVRNSTLSGNNSVGPGVSDIYSGALALQILDDNGGGATLEVVSSTISGNNAVGAGGGVYIYAESGLVPAIRHSTIAFNSADTDSNGGDGGGGILTRGSGATVLLDHTIVAGNKVDQIFDDLGTLSSFTFTGKLCTCAKRRRSNSQRRHKYHWNRPATRATR